MAKQPAMARVAQNIFDQFIGVNLLRPPSLCKTAPVAVGDAEGLCGRAMGGPVRGLYLAFTTRF
jgi:hypothetical protein